MSLKRIALRDFVIVRELELDLAGGFSVLTGETGAGKSILVDALQLALGARTDAGVVREGAQRADITAEFELPAAVKPWLEEAGLDDGDTLLLRRSIDAQGKSRAWINGAAATATQLRELGERLVDIHGQHAWQSLTRPDAVRGLLDAYAGTDAQDLQAPWQRWRAAQKALAEARDAQDSLQRERERLAWQIAEVDKLAPSEGEWDELNASHTRLAHAQSLLEAAQQALDALEGDDGGATAQLARAHDLLQNQEHVEPEYRALAEVLASSQAQAQDAAHSLHAYLRKTDPDPQRLAELDERVALWLSLARRFRRTPAELPGLLAGWRAELARLDASADLAALEAAEQGAAEAFMKQARALSRARAHAAPRLAEAVSQAMQGLGMQGGRFEVALEPVSPPTQGGLEDVAFRVAGHAGSTPRPIGKVASGGELSRIALAIAVTTSQLGDAHTLIFDEVDSGVGGAVAETVGRLMKQLGRDRQVLAVTHLPQVAACADHHLVVSKRSDAFGTASTVTPVHGEQRVGEVARMLGGERLSGTTLAHAKEMLGQRSRDAMTPLEVVLITGMSGSGKSVALRALEDAGYYCVDNLPPELLLSFVALEQQIKATRVAIAMDVRSATSLPLVPAQLRALREQGVAIRPLFLDATTGTLVRRFSETRRRHPLSGDQTGGTPGAAPADQQHALVEAIELERELLADLREQAHVIDTSVIRAAQLMAHVKSLLAAPASRLTLVFESFAFKRGIPVDADYLFDVRMLPNPHYEPDLRDLTGRDAPVQAFLREQPEVTQMYAHIEAFLDHWLEPLARDHRNYVTVAIGCTGGQHRSVYLVEQLAARFGPRWTTLKRHRELDLS